MPKKKAVPDPVAELAETVPTAESLEDAAVPAGESQPEAAAKTVPEETPVLEQDTPPEQETGEAPPPDAEDGAAPEILSVEPDPDPDAVDAESEDMPMPEDLAGDLWPDAAGDMPADAPDWEQTPFPDEGQPLEREQPVPVGDVPTIEEGSPASEEMSAGEAEPASDVPPASEESGVSDKTAEPEPAPRRRAARRTRKTASEAEQPAEPSAAEAAKPQSEQLPRTEGNDRRSFYDLDFNALDRGLSPEQRQEWNSIYASYRGRSVLTGSIAGVDPHTVRVRDRRTGEMVRKTMYCATVILFRVRILIPSTEMWMQGEERPDYVLRNMSGATIDFVVTHVDREAGFAIASRRMALRTRRYYFSTQPSMNRRGARIKCHVLAVGPRRCLVECGGYDIDLTQREMRYTAIPDLREQYRRGEELDCIVKSYDRENGKLTISVKETNPNPFDGAELRHPEGSRRQAEIAGKYAGGVFCNLPDGVVVMCSYSFHYDDAAFAIGDKVIVMIQRYDFGKKQIYGKIVAKW